MNQTKGFLYGHYDSRGGTMFVVADNREQADAAYIKAAGWPEDLAEEAKILCADDFIREVTLYHAKPLTMNADLESNDGYVIVSGEQTEWPPTEDEDSDGCEFFDGTKDNIEYVAPGDSPAFFADGFAHPRWDDDAFSFFVVDGKSANVEA